MFKSRILLTTREAANYIGCSNNSLRQSRVSGILHGVETPAFIKMGFAVRYNRKTLDDWISQFTEQKTTKQ